MVDNSAVVQESMPPAILQVEECEQGRVAASDFHRAMAHLAVDADTLPFTNCTPQTAFQGGQVKAIGLDFGEAVRTAEASAAGP